MSPPVSGRSFFQGILYGNRGVGKSTEINRLLDNDDIKSRFVVIRLDALNDLNPQSFSVADVLLLLVVKLIERCEEKCRDLGRAFPDPQSSEELTRMTGGSREVNVLAFLKIGTRVEANRETLAELSAVIERQISVVRDRLPEFELLVIGENFDKDRSRRRFYWRLSCSIRAFCATCDFTCFSFCPCLLFTHSGVLTRFRDSGEIHRSFTVAAQYGLLILNAFRAARVSKR